MGDKYIFETESEREMRLVTNRHKFLEALSKLKEWYIQILNGKDVNKNTKYLIQGNVYTLNKTQNKKTCKITILKSMNRVLYKIENNLFTRIFLKKIEEILDGTFKRNFPTLANKVLK